MTAIKLPGTYADAINSIPFSISGTETAVPVFMGYTRKITYQNSRLHRKMIKISSLIEFEMKYGKAKPQHLTANILPDGSLDGDVTITPVQFNMHYALRLFFDNGGGPCYIISIGKFPLSPDETKVYSDYRSGLRSLASQTGPTIVALPDAHLAGEGQFYQLFQVALQHAAEVPNRFILVDVFSKNGQEKFADLAINFRTKIGNNNLKNGAAYYPYLQTIFTPYVDEQKEKIFVGNVSFTLRQPVSAKQAALRTSLYHANRPLYNSIINSMNKVHVVLPPSAAIAAVYCKTDRIQGVWKAPANVSLSGVHAPTSNISDAEQEAMNIDAVAGKSVNAIRSFTGKGTLVWGARTLAGNDHENRYVSVWRFRGFIEASVSAAIQAVATEVNDTNTWLKIQTGIENFLTGLWREGALMGTKPGDAFYVAVGLGRTMTQADIQQGRLIVHIGFAPLKPAEFIIIRIQQIMDR